MRTSSISRKWGILEKRDRRGVAGGGGGGEL